MFRDKSKSIIIISIIFLLSFLVFFSFVKYESGEFGKNISNITQKKYITSAHEENKFFTLKVGEKTFQLGISPNTSLYDSLVAARKEGKIDFSAKKYNGLGFFVTQINDLRNGDRKYLFYYINGKEASVGVSDYYPQDGDEVLWKLK